MKKLFTATIAFVFASLTVWSQNQINTTTQKNEVKEVQKVESRQVEGAVLSPASSNRKPTNNAQSEVQKGESVRITEPSEIRAKKVSPARIEE
ncbi:MAG: hypothetical protein JJT77_02020 [Crocinitomicaceae bacterium]|jgi:hypothetical protein|nr:hypothetical protein [Crocinitomicaceae bacterium]